MTTSTDPIEEKFFSDYAQVRQLRFDSNGLCDFILLILQSLTECGLKPLILLRESFLDLERSLECGDEITVAGFKI